jgi:hypothetical protein
MRLVRQRSGSVGGSVVGDTRSDYVSEPEPLRKYVERGRHGKRVGKPAECPDCGARVIDDLQPHRCVPAFRRYRVR